ncbi:3-phosphoshikimate 1-carboxyvinyltransferase [Sphingomonas mesophila]|uniref:3-phosphoshikimate 1-carboxyvinyltransferase n=1 Tax=Sphingomonas mesophila TaxID=2303576 RepID=UPI000E573A0E|nr:3-phosphoshikimate 1-carboxyvinyltransferase [Sphingomonas mesophila]
MLTARRGGPLKGLLRVPGDKSCSHRALILGAMRAGETVITGLNDGEDVGRTAAALSQFGVRVEADRVVGGAWRSPSQDVDCGNSGTTARLLIGAVAGMPGVEARFVGDASLSRRPMGRLVAPLRRMGAVIEGGETLPLTVRGGPLEGIAHANDPPSAQVKSALLLAGLAAGVEVRVEEPATSRDHTEIMLAHAGAEIAIAGDPSAAAFGLVAAAVVPGSEVRVEGLLANPLRVGFLRVLERMGADVEWSNARVQSGERVADVRVRHAPLMGCRVTADAVPGLVDEVPTLAVACARAEGASVIEGVGELRVKESDRLAAIVAGLGACGIDARVEGDDLHIFGGRSRGGVVRSEGDHRIAMAFLTLGLASAGPVSVDEESMIATSFPGFVEGMRGIGAEIA